MVRRGRRLRVGEATGWYDCGKVDTLLETNRHLLEQGRARLPGGPCPRCTIVPPVYVEEGVTLHDVTIGPNVAIEAGRYVPQSTQPHSIPGPNARVGPRTAPGSPLGDRRGVETKGV